MQRIQQQALCAIRSYNTEKIIVGHKLRDGLSKKVQSGQTGTSFFVLEVPLRYLLPCIIYSVPCDRNLQKGLFSDLFIATERAQLNAAHA